MKVEPHIYSLGTEEGSVDGDGHKGLQWEVQGWTVGSVSGLTVGEGGVGRLVVSDGQ